MVTCGRLRWRGGDRQNPSLSKGSSPIKQSCGHHRLTGHRGSGRQHTASFPRSRHCWAAPLPAGRVREGVGGNGARVECAGSRHAGRRSGLPPDAI